MGTQGTRPYEPREAGEAGDPTAARAALGLGLLAVGGWLLNIARPWQKPGHALVLAAGWTVSGALLVCGLVLLARCVRTVHGSPDPEGRGIRERRPS
ncbi:MULTISPECIES: hypothetical protein [Streptomyces]|uniref:Integral membrane protein n=1 Tax=Streptomyces amritsarensis TaxID=681158 RepID=A0ABX3G758_9ACTN|nr:MULTISPECIES: hypothetical protein [Streptomyces]AQT73853.1 hypothetical protein B1K54_21400 [Streptomyces sp. fd1-xmd]MDX6758310.1 hypothetical protein [Streptomyces sp. F8]OLZ69117.1 hypothetical protein AVW11_10985 [Streptomyces amritsarensis]